MDGPSTYDVIVVGAGPAGSAFVRTLRDEAPDARVLVLDKARFPRDKVCGDALTHTSVPLIAEIFPELSTSIPTRSATRRYTLRYPDGRSFSRDDQDLDVVPRRVLDDLLWRSARHDALDIVEGARVVDLVVGDDRSVRGVVATVDGQRRQIGASIVVAADGSASRVRRRLPGGPGVTPPSAVRQYVRDVPPSDDGLVFVVDPDHHGYFWFFPIADADGGGWSANIGWFGFGPRGTVNPRDRLEAHLTDPVVRRYLGGGRREGDVQGFPINLASRRGRKLVAGDVVRGDGYVLVGDAAGFVHPFTGEGIAFALWSGREAARLLARSAGPHDVGPTYEAGIIEFAEDAYSMTRTNMLFRVPCVLPRALRSPYLASLPVLDRARKVVKRGRNAVRRSG